MDANQVCTHVDRLKDWKTGRLEGPDMRVSAHFERLKKTERLANPHENCFNRLISKMETELAVWTNAPPEKVGALRKSLAEMKKSVATPVGAASLPRFDVEPPQTGVATPLRALRLRGENECCNAFASFAPSR